MMDEGTSTLGVTIYWTVACISYTKNCNRYFTIVKCNVKFTISDGLEDKHCGFKQLLGPDAGVALETCSNYYYSYLM